LEPPSTKFSQVQPFDPDAAGRLFPGIVASGSPPRRWPSRPAVGLPRPVVVARSVADPPPVEQPREMSQLQHQVQEPPQPRATLETTQRPAAHQSMQSQGAEVATEPRSLPQNKPPRYPRRALHRRLEGTVLLRLQIQTTGRVGNVSVVDSSGHRVLDDAAVAAVRRWKFTPATRNEKPVESVLTQPVQFQIR